MRLYSESVNLDEREEPLVFPAFFFISSITYIYSVGKFQLTL